MASHLSFSEEDFSCCVCHDIFRHPLVLPCSHTFCKACLQEWWTHKKRRECPVCKKISSVNPPFNRALNNLCETYMKEKHLDNKEGAQESLKLSQEITALREEVERKSRMMKEEMQGLNRNISTISNAIWVIEEDLKAERISFLQNKTAVETLHMETLHDSQLLSGAAGELLDKAKNLDNLTFSIWDKMKNIVPNTPVIREPYTAHQDRILSDDLPSERQKLPDISEESDSSSSSSFVMGSEGFKRGTHSWDVEVGDNRWWTVGVAKRDGGRFWRLRLYHGAYIAQSLSESFTILSVKQKPRRIRVQLDMDRGTLSFSDPGANAHLHTFTDTFTDTLVPFIYNCDHAVPLKMLSNQC